MHLRLPSLMMKRSLLPLPSALALRYGTPWYKWSLCRELCATQSSGMSLPSRPVEVRPQVWDNRPSACSSSQTRLTVGSMYFHFLAHVCNAEQRYDCFINSSFGDT